MKIDAFHYVQLERAYRDLHPELDEVTDLRRWHPAFATITDARLYGKGPSIKQLMDISLPEMPLLSCMVNYFLSHGLEFDQIHLPLQECERWHPECARSSVPTD
jgi:hypothetical protein